MNIAEFGFGAVEAELVRILFLMVRWSAAFLVAPLFGGVAVPVQLRLVLAGALAAFTSAWVPLPPSPAALSLAALLAVAGEVVIGLAYGFALQLFFAAPVIAAEIVAGSMGVAVATSVDPASGAQSGVLGHYFTVLLTLVFLGTGGHLLWLRLVLDSFVLLPPGQAWFGGERALHVTGLAAEMFATALAICLPVTLALLLVQIATGVLSRAAPALNLFALGLPAGVLAGLAALLATAPILQDRLLDLSILAIEGIGGLATL